MNEKDIFLAALEKTLPAERAAFVEQACGADAALRAAVQELLQTYAAANQFLETPAVEVDAAGPLVSLPHTPPAVGDPGAERVAGEEDFRRYLQPTTRAGWLGRLGHYEIEAVLGRGAFGIVAKAYDEKLQRVVAIKLMRPELAETSPPRRRFLREARTAAAVTHESIVAIHAVEGEPIPYLVMEYVAGPTLQQRIDQRGPLEIPEILRIGQQVASGLAAAHAVNLIHRDIKPTNVLLTGGPNERAKISDFGLARAADDASLTTSGLIAGTPLYMSPEQARGEPLDQRTDLFSLGSVLYQMACGRPPFRAAHTAGVLKRVCEDAPRPLRDVLPEIPGWLESVVFRLMEKNKENRYQTAREVAELLELCQSQWHHQGHVTCVADHAPTTELAVASTRSALRRGTRLGSLGGLIGGVLLCVLGYGGYAWLNDSASPPASATPARSGRVPSRSDSQAAPETGATGWYGWPADAPRPAIVPFDSEEATALQRAWARYLGLPLDFTNSIGLAFRLLPPGEFLRGSPAQEQQEALAQFGSPEPNVAQALASEGPQHRVVLTRPMYASVTEVTQRQFHTVMGKNPSCFAPTGPRAELTARVAQLDTSHHPVENVSWTDAIEFCDRLSQHEELPAHYSTTTPSAPSRDRQGYRLPSDAEWEFACRAGTITRYWSGETPRDALRVGWLAGSSANRTHAVGGLPANPFGLRDMIGNVIEWCEDPWSPHDFTALRPGPVIDPSGSAAGTTQRTLRGGSWVHAPTFGRSAGRHGLEAGDHNDVIGFRLVLSIEAVARRVTRSSP